MAYKKVYPFCFLMFIYFFVGCGSTWEKIDFIQADSSNWVSKFEYNRRSFYYFFCDSNDISQLNWPLFRDYDVNFNRKNEVPLSLNCTYILFEWEDSGQNLSDLRKYNSTIQFYLKTKNDKINATFQNSKCIINDSLFFPIYVASFTSYYEPEGTRVSFIPSDTSKDMIPVWKQKGNIDTLFNKNDFDKINNYLVIRFYFKSKMVPDSVKNLTIILDSVEINGVKRYVDTLNLKTTKYRYFQKGKFTH